MSKILITGGTGTLGLALLQRLHEQHELTVLSRDYLRQAAARKQFPNNVHFILGDVADYDTVYTAVVGHDLVIHAAAQKHIPAAEMAPDECVRINVGGSQNVAMAAIMAGVQRVVGISTDKAAAPANVYGATKFLMERLFTHLDATQEVTSFTCCRYGNVLASNGSVLQVWANQAAQGMPLTITDPSMTRFWLSLEQAVNLVVFAMENTAAVKGSVVIPQARSLDMGSMAEYLYPEHERIVIGRRPGEKTHELLMTADEGKRCVDLDSYGGPPYWEMVPENVPLHEQPHLADIHERGFSSADARPWKRSALLDAVFGEGKIGEEDE